MGDGLQRGAGGRLELDDIRADFECVDAACVDDDDSRHNEYRSDIFDHHVDRAARGGIDHHDRHHGGVVNDDDDASSFRRPH